MAKLRKVRLTDVNHLLTCSICRGYLIDAITINVCMHSFCRVCILKHINVLQKYSCPECNAEIRLSNLRSDFRLRSIAYKIVPGLVRGEEIENLRGLNEIPSAVFSNCSEDKLFRNQYFFDQEEPISLSIQYHMESLGILDNSFKKHCNIPQIRYLLAPAAFKVSQIKKFLSSKYDLSYFKKPMQVDIIYENKILLDDFSLMDVAYIFQWTREAPMRIFYRIRKCEKASRGKIEKTKHADMRDSRRMSTCFGDNNQINESLSDKKKELNKIEPNSKQLHNLKIIIAKKRISVKTKNRKDDEPDVSNWNAGVKNNLLSKTHINKRNEKHRHPKSTMNSVSTTMKRFSTEFSVATNYKSCNKSQLHGKKGIEEITRKLVSRPSETDRPPYSVVPKLRLSAIKTKCSPKSFHEAFEMSINDSESTKKKVRFDDNVKKISSPIKIDQEPTQLDQNNMDQMTYANSIGLQPVSSRKVDSLLLHRKRRKSKCGYGKTNQFQISPKLYNVSQSTFEIFNNENENKKINSTCLLETETTNMENKVIKSQTLDQSNIVKIDNNSGTSSSLTRNGEEETSGYKYSLTEQKHFDEDSNSIQFIPKLVFSKPSQVSSSCTTEETSPITNDHRSNSVDNLQTTRITASLSNVSCAQLKNSDFNTKPPRAKMGSPKQSVVSSSSSSPQIDPIRPQSIPASLKLSQHSHSTPAYEDWLLSKRSLSIDENHSQNQRFHLFQNLKSANSCSGLRLNMDTGNVAGKKLESDALPLNKPSIHQNFGENTIGAQKINTEQLGKGFSFSTQLTKTAEMTTKCGKSKNLPVNNLLGYVNYSNDRPIQKDFKTNLEDSSSELQDFRSNNETFNLERYTLELRNDIAKLQHNLNMEKSFEDFFEAQKSNEFWQLNLNSADSTINCNNSRLQQPESSSIRAIPNPAFLNLRGTSTEAAIRKKRTMMQEYAEIKKFISSMEAKKTEISTKFGNNIEKRKMEVSTEILNEIEDKNNNKNMSQSLASVKPFASIFRISGSTQN